MSARQGLNRYRMLAVDLDGTLFDSNGRVPEENRRAILKAREAGMLVVLCTGRGLCETRYAIEALGHEGPVVLAGGALVTDPTTGKTLHRALIEANLAARVTEQLRNENEAVLILLDPDPQDHDYLVVGDQQQLNENTRWWFGSINASVRYVDRPRPEDMHHALRVGIVAEQRVMPPIQAALVHRFGERVMVQHFLAVKREDDHDVHVLEVFAGGVNKWSGLKWLAEEHRVELGEVAAIGDHINDVAMVEQAACGIAMGNAVDAVRNVADRVTATNDECGVAQAIENLLSGKW